MSPIGAQYDYQLGGKGYMLVRGQYAGRAWQRTGQPDTPSRRSEVDAKYGVVEDTLDHPEVWDDWSGGFGQAYRRAGENTYHWAENFDARWPRQLVHCQALRNFVATISVVGSGIQIYFGNAIQDVDIPNVSQPAAGTGAVLITGGSGNSYQCIATPKAAASFDILAVNTVASNLVFQAVPWGSYYYMGVPTGSSIERITRDGVATLGALPGGVMAVAGNRLWATSGIGQRGQQFLRSVAGQEASMVLTTSNWSATLNIGNGEGYARSIAVSEDQLFIGMPDGLYAGDTSGSFFNVLTDLGVQVAANNCQQLTMWENNIIIPHRAGILAYNPGAVIGRVTEIGPQATNRGASPVIGEISAIRGYGQWLYAALSTYTGMYLTAGRREGEQVIWHTLQKPPPGITINPSLIHIDSVTVSSGGAALTPRFWVSQPVTALDINGAVVSSGIKFFPMPPGDSNPLAPNVTFSPNYNGSARIDLGAVDWNAPSTGKVFRAVDLWAQNLASGAQWCDVYYTLDGGTRTLLGTVAESPKDTLYFPSTISSFTTGQSIALSLESFTASYGVTPIYRAVVLRGSLRPRSIDQITAVTRIADGLVDRLGTPMRPGAVMLGELRGFATGSAPVTLVDLAGATQIVAVLPPVGEQEVYQTGQDNPEIAATVRMALMTFTGG